MREVVDNLVIGGGIYGTNVALILNEELPKQKTLLVESESELMVRASTNNHGRLHAGYQYPSSTETALEAKLCKERFLADYADCVDSEDALYAIHEDSLITGSQYEEFCDEVGLELVEPDSSDTELFGQGITNVYRILEQTFSSIALRNRILGRVADSGLEVVTGCSVGSIEESDRRIGVRLNGGKVITARRVFNCAYSAINGIHSDAGLPNVATVNEKYLLFGISLPVELIDTSVTVAYGQFSSFVVNRGVGGHVLADVVESNLESTLYWPPDRGKTEDAEVRYMRSIAHSIGYLPILAEAEYTGRNIEEIKSFIGKGSSDNAQGCRSSIIFEDYGGVAGYHIIFGGKVTGFYKAAEFALNAARGESTSTVLAGGCGTFNERDASAA